VRRSESGMVFVMPTQSLQNATGHYLAAGFASICHLPDRAEFAPMFTAGVQESPALELHLTSCWMAISNAAMRLSERVDVHSER